MTTYIPFIRNIIEYTRGEEDPDYILLTSLLHWKNDSGDITQGKLDEIFNSVFQNKGDHPGKDSKVINGICAEAENCLEGTTGINFENKIVLSIAIRIVAEQYMVAQINDQAFVASIQKNQTSSLLNRYKAMFSNLTTNIETLQRVILMTPENIHLNSFMYEPILDMADTHLIKLYKDIKDLA